MIYVNAMKLKTATYVCYSIELLDIQKFFFSGNQVADLEIFRAKQESYLARRQQQQDTLQFRQEDHVRKLESIRKKDQTDRDRLKKDMIQKMNLVAADFRRASNKQMAETTKRTINENARIEQTVNDMGDITTRVHNENEHIQDGVGLEINRSFFFGSNFFFVCLE
jgi:hypothetical protein